MTKYVTSDKKPSKVFLDSLSGGGSHYMICGNCGREHYCPDSSSIYDGDGEDDKGDREYYLQNALEQQKDDPEGVVIHYDVDCALTKDLGGIAFVLECPCNGLWKYENFIWNNKNEIRDYLKVRIEQEFEWAQQELTKNKLAGISNSKGSGDNHAWEGY